MFKPGQINGSEYQTDELRRIPDGQTDGSEYRMDGGE
jgi:hypothetical protein